jgi:hypothetical protein
MIWLSWLQRANMGNCAEAMLQFQNDFRGTGSRTAAWRVARIRRPRKAVCMVV